ncbi:HlyB/MsbA family ABC transporter [Acrocarpospora phusangensis]|uniref:HlyB/MsbA family ABC transporter n=1 Tax=Acrocarpospora phusangensis TaxID=1070424 RepID=A0A919Q7I1_9ACTN|nr:ABC transporter ATP-binding protein [Acrocarpospora phusangensis]GIH23621.1 HlyB/MsbA family ABC transporter [Acrocarpospora phusangensis]
MLVQRRMLGLARGAVGPMAMTALLSLSASAAGAGQAVALVETVRRALISGAPDPAGIGGPLAVTGLLVVLRSLLLWGRDQSANWTASLVQAWLRARLAERLLDLGPGYTVTRPAGTLRTTIADGVEAIRAYVGFYLPQVVVSVGGPLVIVAILTWQDPVAGALAGVCVVLVPASRPLWRRIMGTRSQRHWIAYENFSARVLDALQGMTTLKALGATGLYGNRLRRDALALYRATMGDLAASSSVYVISAFLMTAGTSLAVVVAAIRYSTGHLDAAGLLLIAWLTAEAFRPLLELQNYWHEGFHGLAAGKGVFALLDAEPPAPAAPTTGEPVTRPPRLALREVTFTYPGAARPALRDVSLVVEPGTTLAISGRSGSGKSTLVNLLQRYFDPATGRILADGTDLRDLDRDAVRAMTAVVSQDTYLFHGTIAENLRLARPDADLATLRQAARRARIFDFVDALPDGFDTVVGERGARLSGGERQRIAIARALLKDAPVLILDEATSAVDGETEAALREALAELRAGRTTIMIAHRLSSLIDADTVAVLDDGELIEYGSPADLAAQSGAWSELVAAQNGGAP